MTNDDVKSRDFLGNELKNGDYAIIFEYRNPFIVVITELYDNVACFVYDSESNLIRVDSKRSLNKGKSITKNMLKIVPNQLNKFDRKRASIIRKHIKTIE